jgi:hypothetical protein
MGNFKSTSLNIEFKNYACSARGNMKSALLITSDHLATLRGFRRNSHPLIVAKQALHMQEEVRNSRTEQNAFDVKNEI